MPAGAPESTDRSFWSNPALSAAASLPGRGRSLPAGPACELGGLSVCRPFSVWQRSENRSAFSFDGRFQRRHNKLITTLPTPPRCNPACSRLEVADMARLCIPALACCLCALAAGPARAAKPRATGDFFEKKVRPLLAETCLDCHGPKKQRGGLRLDSRAGMMSGGDSGPAIVPGKPDASRLVKAIHYNGDVKMPPKGKLKPDQVAILVEWVRQGAPWPEAAGTVRTTPEKGGFKVTDQDRAFWSFRPIRNPTPPTVTDTLWARTSLDPFVLARLEEKGLKPVAPADRRTLIRRATFDLTGLPPTPEEVEAFVKDTSADAWRKVVDRLLSSPHYGERWARHWLDIARYGEDQAHTFQARKYPQGYRYRDWVVHALNDDMPYDRFVKEQIAADLLADPDRLENLPALGFFALGPVYYGDPKKLDQYDDRIDTLSRGLLGLTVACARCHDHKYDPISQKDYYGLAGIIAGTDYTEAAVVPPEVVEEAKRKQAEKDAKNPKNTKNKKGKRKQNGPPPYPYAHALKEGKPVTMRVHLRGNPQTLGEDAPRRFLEILAPDCKPFTKGSGRLELAEAIVNPENPLTARVIVNRVWQHHFGHGIVRTASNFGVLGERPTHPELLDHLTSRFIASGWSLKKLHREIMLSAVYQLSGAHSAENHAQDPENRLLWRMNRRRLEVEAWRDAMLAAAGTLDPTLGGPSLNLADPNNRRRTFYGAVSRHELDNLLRLFDFPDPNITSGERTVTTVPLQQLFVLNSEFMVRNAKALVARLDRAGGSEGERLDRAFRILYARPPIEGEVRLGMAFLQSGGKEKTPLSRWEQYAQVLLSANEFLYVD
jgi:mono/diheme cytochrome c family protein